MSRLVQILLFSFFAISVQAQNTIWYEDFSSYSNGVDQGAEGSVNNRWSVPSCSGCNISNSNDYFDVRSNAFVGRDMDGTGTWLTESISIAAYTNVGITIDVRDLDNPDANDNITLSYSTNGGGSYTTLTNGSFTNDISGTQVASATGITGTTLLIRVQMTTNGNNDIYEFDNVKVTGTLANQPGSGNCLDFADQGGSNGDYILLPDYFPDLVSTDFTVAAWINSDNVGSQGQRVFCYDESNSPAGFSLSLGDGGSGRLRFYVRGASGGGGVILDVTNSDYFLSSNTWYHVAITHSTSGNNARKIYINGVLVASDTYTSNPSGKAGRASIAGETDDGETSNRFNGEIDEMSIWSDDLTQTEIRNLMCKKLAGNETDLMAYYRFDETTGTIASDATGNYPGDLKAMDPASDWVTSGASIGNTSTYEYNSGAWAGQTVLHTSPDGDSLQVSLVTGDPECVHIYNVSEQPNSSSGSSGVGGNSNYYGVFHGFGTGTTYTSTLFYGENNAFQASDALDESFIQVYTRSNNAVTSWTLGTATLNVVNKTLTLVATSTEFILGNSQNPLPVALIELNGVAEEHHNRIYWKTATEVNSDRFEVERSLAGEDWQQVGSIPAAGNSKQTIAYAFKDSVLTESRLYYRLKSIDKDGSTSISDVIEVTRSIKTSPDDHIANFILYPNPTQNTESIRIKSNISLTEYNSIAVYDYHGKRMLEQALTWSENKYELELKLNSELPTGYYILMLMNSKSVKSFRLIVE